MKNALLSPFEDPANDEIRRMLASGQHDHHPSEPDRQVPEGGPIEGSSIIDGSQREFIDRVVNAYGDADGKRMLQDPSTVPGAESSEPDTSDPNAVHEGEVQPSSVIANLVRNMAHAGQEDSGQGSVYGERDASVRARQPSPAIEGLVKTMLHERGVNTSPEQVRYEPRIAPHTSSRPTRVSGAQNPQTRLSRVLHRVRPNSRRGS